MSVKKFVMIALAVVTNAVFASTTRGAGANCRAILSDAQTRRVDIPLLPSRWSWDIGGLNLIRHHSHLAQADYDRNRLAIIDTGLLLRGNPQAGAKLQAASPELEFHNGGHGTGVTGVAASLDFGVNPLLSVVPLASRYYDPHDGDIDEITINRQSGNLGLDPAALYENLRKAIRDPKVKVINLSLSTAEDSEGITLMKKAMEAKKWIVTSEGNTVGKTNDRRNAGMAQLMQYQEFFVIGSLSYFAAPASFAHGGIETQYYAPGTSIESLSHRYNPNWDALGVTPTSMTFDGSSFAAPHGAAIFTTARALLPDLSVRQLRMLIEKTSLIRGRFKKIHQINDYALLWALLHARQLHLALPQLSLDDCLNRTLISMNQQVSHLLTKITTQQLNLKTLKEGYFLSRGRREFATRIVAQISHKVKGPTAESVYFQPGEADLLPVLNGFSNLHGHAKTERDAAIAFYAPPRPSQQVLDTPVQMMSTLDRAHLLGKVPATIPNVPEFLHLIGDILTGEEDDIDALHYVSNAPKQFLFTVAERVRGNDRFAWASFAIQLKNRAETDAEKDLAQSLLNQSALNWILSQDFTGLKGLLARMGDLSPTARKALIEHFFEVVNTAQFRRLNPRLDREEVEWAEANLLSWAAPEVIGNRRGLVEQRLKGSKRVSEGKLILAYQQHRGGFISSQQLLDSFAETLADNIAHPEQRNMASGSSLAYVIKQTAKRDPHLALKLSELLDTPSNMRGMIDIMPGRTASEAVATLIQHMPEEIGASLLHQVANSWASKADREGASWVLHTWFHVKETTAGRQFEQRLMAQRQNDPGLQAVRIQILQFRARTATEPNAAVHAFLDEAPPRMIDQMENLLALSSRVVLANERLRAQFIQQLEEAKNCQRDCHNHLLWAEQVNSVDDFRVIAREVVPRLASLIRHSTYYFHDNLEKLAMKLGSYEGSNAELIGTALIQIKELFDDPSFMQSSGRPGSDLDTERRDRIAIVGLQLLGITAAGARRLASSQAWIERAANYLIHHPERTLLLYDIPVPRALSAALRARFLSPTEYAKLSREPKWMRALFTTDAESFAQIIRYLDAPEVRANSELTTSLADHMKYGVIRFPELAHLVDEFFARHPREAVSEIYQIVYNRD